MTHTEKLTASFGSIDPLSFFAGEQVARLRTLASHFEQTMRTLGAQNAVCRINVSEDKAVSLSIKWSGDSNPVKNFLRRHAIEKEAKRTFPDAGAWTHRIEPGRLRLVVSFRSLGEINPTKVLFETERLRQALEADDLSNVECEMTQDIPGKDDGFYDYSLRASFDAATGLTAGVANCLQRRKAQHIAREYYPFGRVHSPDL